jgi:hypothetical protein
VPAYVICHDATLAAIAEARPASGDELMQVNGMGPAKLQRYGLQILAEVRAHAAEHGERASAPSPATDDAVPAHLSRNFSEYQLRVRETHARAYERWSDEEDERVIALARAGGTADDIAAELQRQPAAITMRLEKLGLAQPAAPAS